MKLFFRKIPFDSSQNSNNIPFIVLHGLFGSSKNWLGAGKLFAKFGDVYLLDLRNHGDSPHSPTHTLQGMAEDVQEFLETYQLKDPVLVGHSMGGLVSMLFAKLFPNQARALLIEDIAPKHYPFVYDKELQCFELPVENLPNREAVDREMAKILPDPFIRQFLAMNLERREEDGFSWKVNYKAIAHSRQIFEEDFVEFPPSQLSALFLLGDPIGYVKKEDENRILSQFPKARIERIAGGGHYLHYTHNGEFQALAEAWLDQVLKEG